MIWVLIRWGAPQVTKQLPSKNPTNDPSPSNFGRYKAYFGDLLSNPIFGFFNHSTPKVKTEQSLSAVKAEIPSRLSALKSKSMKLLMATKVPSLCVNGWGRPWDDETKWGWSVNGRYKKLFKGGLSTSSKGKVPPKKGEVSKVCFGGMVDLWKFSGPSGGLRWGCGSIRWFKLGSQILAFKKSEGYKNCLLPCFFTPLWLTKSNQPSKTGPCCWCLGTGHCEGSSPSGARWMVFDLQDFHPWFCFRIIRGIFELRNFPIFVQFFCLKSIIKKDVWVFWSNWGGLYDCTTPWLEGLWKPMMVQSLNGGWK